MNRELQFFEYCRLLRLAESPNKFWILGVRFSVCFLSLLLVVVVTAMAPDHDVVEYYPNNLNYHVDGAVEDAQVFSSAMTDLSHDAFHLLSHGKSGMLLINNQWLDAAAIAVWINDNNFLINKNHLNIYGCEFAKGDKGYKAVKKLEQLLQKSVSASDDITGIDGDWDLEVGVKVSALEVRGYNGNLQTGPTDDFDGDGVLNQDDIDDDNDGIPDTIESPDCFPENTYISNVFPNITSTITSDIAMTNPNNIDDNDISTNGNFPFGSRSAGTVFFQFDFGAGNSFQFDEILFTDPEGGNSFVWGETNFDIEASNNATTWDNVGNITLVNGNSQQYPISIPITASTEYRYYRIVKNSGGNGSLANAIGEVDFRFGGTIDQFQDFSCADTDHFNLDSDGDGCSDAEEAFVAPANDLVDDGTLTNAKFDFISPTNDADGDGLYDSSSFDDSEGNRTDGFCPDVDGDGILNNIDLDDDNDGILDVDEMDCTGFTIDIDCSANLLQSEGFGAGDELSNQLDTILGWVFSRDSDLDGNFTETIPLDETCGQLSLGTNTDTYSRPFKVESVSRSDGVTPTPFTDNVIQLRQDCAAGNEIFEFEALDENGMVLYTETLSQTGNNACVEVMLRPGIDVYQLIFYQSSSATVITGNKITKCIDIDTDMDGIPDRYDLDSDGDGCSDALEGGGSYTLSDVVTDTNIDGGNSGTNFNGDPMAGAVQENLGIIVDSDGVPNTDGDINTDDSQVVGDSQDAATMAMACEEILPVDLIYFNAVRDGSNSLLTWETAIEIDNDRYEIERSNNGVMFKSIVSVKGAGTTSIKQNYQYVDENPMKGVNYYRLKQLDYDGKYVYSPIRTLIFASNIKTDLNARYFPNPVRNALSITTDIELENHQVRLIDMHGRTLLNRGFTSGMFIDMHDILGGIYLAEIVDANGYVVDRQRIVK